MYDFLSDTTLRATLTILSSLVISFYAIPKIILVARIKQLYDEPNGRTSHKVKTPTLGGIAIFASLVISTFLFIDPTKLPWLQYFLASLTIVFFIGLKDDLLLISPAKKLIAQLMAALIITVLADIRISNFHGFMGITELNYYFSIFITIISIVGIINGFNLIDGIDGLASGVGIVTSLTFGIWFAYAKEWEYFILALGLIGSLIAFFYFNVFSKKHKLFMGDTGSLIIGLTISVLMISFVEFNIPGSEKASVSAAAAVALGILIIPLFDTLQVMIIRMLNGKSPFQPDRTHLHHVILDFGFSHVKATLFILTSNLIIILLFFAMQSLPINLLISIYIAFCILSAIVLVFIRKAQRLKKESTDNNQEQLKPENINRFSKNGNAHPMKSNNKAKPVEILKELNLN